MILNDKGGEKMEEINPQLEKAAQILGQSYESLLALDRQTKENLAGAAEMAEFTNVEEGVKVYEELERIWQEGQINLEIEEMAQAYKEKLLSLSLQEKKHILFEWQKKMKVNEI